MGEFSLLQSLMCLFDDVVLLLVLTARYDHTKNISFWDPLTRKEKPTLLRSQLCKPSVNRHLTTLLLCENKGPSLIFLNLNLIPFVDSIVVSYYSTIVRVRSVSSFPFSLFPPLSLSLSLSLSLFLTFPTLPYTNL